MIIKKKFTIGEILATRKIGTLGKHSTEDEVIALLGVPNTITQNYNKYDNYYMIYGNLGIQISGVKKRIMCILISNYDGPTKRTFKFGKNKILRDWSHFSKLDSVGIKEYLLKYNVPTEETEYIEGLSSAILPLDNKYYTKSEPRFTINYRVEEKSFTSILILYNYRSKKRD